MVRKAVPIDLRSQFLVGIGNGFLPRKVPIVKSLDQFHR